MRAAPLMAFLLAACPGKPSKPPARELEDCVRPFRGKPWDTEHAWTAELHIGPERTTWRCWTERTGIVTKGWRDTEPGEYRPPTPPPDWSANPRGETAIMRMVSDLTEERFDMRQRTDPDKGHVRPDSRR